jgi:dynein heavy chain
MFAKLEPEDLTTTTVKYGKTVYQLEKGLPPNSVIPMLKDKVDSMRQKVTLYSVTNASV